MERQSPEGPINWNENWSSDNKANRSLDLALALNWPELGTCISPQSGQTNEMECLISNPSLFYVDHKGIYIF